MNDFPPIRHAIGIGIVRAGIHQQEIGVLTGRCCAVHGDVSFANGGGDGDDLTWNSGLVLQTVNRGIISGDGPKPPVGANQHLIAGGVDALNAVGLPRHLPVDAGVKQKPAVVNGIVVEVELVQPGRRSKPKNLSVGGSGSVEHHGADLSGITG